VCLEWLKVQLTCPNDRTPVEYATVAAVSHRTISSDTHTQRDGLRGRWVEREMG
jgi:hypothetical protein